MADGHQALLACAAATGCTESAVDFENYNTPQRLTITLGVALATAAPV